MQPAVPEAADLQGLLVQAPCAGSEGYLNCLAQGVVKYACSEEVPEPVDLQGSGFSVAFDPLDGSSIVDTNFTVGTIFGVWPGDKLTGITGRDQVPACLP